MSCNSPFRNAACTSAVSNAHFFVLHRMASRQAVGESLRMSDTSGSAYPGTKMRADAFVSNGFSAVLLPSFLSTSTNRDCMTRSYKTLFPQRAPYDFGFSWRYHRRCCIFLPYVPLFGNGLKEQQLLTTGGPHDPMRDDAMGW